MKKNPDLHDQADRLLETIGTHTARIKETSRVYGEKLAAVKALLETAVAEDAAALAAAEKALKKLMKKNKSEFFPADQDRLNLVHGSLLYKARDVVTRGRKITAEFLEKLGYATAVRVVKSIDWDKIEKWPDVKLAEIGTERKQTEKFEWELKGGNRF